MPFRSGLLPAQPRTNFVDRLLNDPNSLISNAGDGYTYRPPREVKDIYTPPPRRVHHTAPAPRKIETPKAEVSPALERAITSLDASTKAMPDGPLKASLEAVQSSLELAKQAQARGDATAYQKAISDLGSKTFGLVGELVQTVGKDPALAEAGASQLKKIAGVLGRGSKVIGSLDAASKLVSGKTLSGTPVDNNARADAAFDLVSGAVPGPVQAGMVISKETLVALYNHVGIPTHRAIEEHGLRSLFGASPDAVKARIDALPTSPDKAMWTVSTLFSKTFTNRTSGYSQATASSMWETHMKRELAGYNQEMELLNTYKRTKPGQDPMVDELRTRMAERYKSAAQRFVAGQVADARGNW